MDNNNLNNGAVAPINSPTYGQPQSVQLPQTPVNCDAPLSVTSLSDLQVYSQGCIVRLPDFAEGQPFVARVKRPSMLVLAKSGRIPNSLLNAAGDLFAKGNGGLDTDNSKMLEDMQSICTIIAEASLMQPTLQDLTNSGIELTDEQLMAIFNYSQVGFKALDSFRKKQEHS